MHTGETDKPSLEEVQEYLENGCIKIHKRPILQGGKLIGTEILEYTYDKDGYKSVNSTKLGLDGKPFAHP